MRVGQYSGPMVVEVLAEGPAGRNGWVPVLAAVRDGERSVHQVVNWAGGTGAKPATGQYVGAAGLVDNITDASNVRGLVGDLTEAAQEAAQQVAEGASQADEAKTEAQLRAAQAVTAFEGADAARLGAQAEAISSGQAATAASAAAGIAIGAKDAALIQGGVYTTEAVGRAAVADGVAFKVQGNGTTVAAYEYRRVSAAVSAFITSYPATGYVDQANKAANRGAAVLYAPLAEPTDGPTYELQDPTGAIAADRASLYILKMIEDLPDPVADRSVAAPLFSAYDVGGRETIDAQGNPLSGVAVDQFFSTALNPYFAAPLAEPFDIGGEETIDANASPVKGIPVSAYLAALSGGTPVPVASTPRLYVVQAAGSITWYEKNGNPNSNVWIEHRIFRAIRFVNDPDQDTDVWIRTASYECTRSGNAFTRLRRFIRAGEWETAIKLVNPDTGVEYKDFIGGLAHGQEYYEFLMLLVDGVRRDIDSYGSYECDEIFLSQHSRLYRELGGDVVNLPSTAAATLSGQFTDGLTNTWRQRSDGVGRFGTFAIGSNGSWSYQVDNAKRPISLEEERFQIFTISGVRKFVAVLVDATTLSAVIRSEFPAFLKKQQWEIKGGKSVLSQSLEFLNDLTVYWFYAAMLPIERVNEALPTQQITDQASRDADWVMENCAVAGFGSVETNANAGRIWGPTGLSARVEVLEGWTQPGRNFRVSDNTPFNKLYFSFYGKNTFVPKGTVLKMKAAYEIKSIN